MLIFDKRVRILSNLYQISTASYNDSSHKFFVIITVTAYFKTNIVVKHPARDACLDMGENQAPCFVFLITL